MTVMPDRVLIDGNWDFVGGGRTRRIIKGDATCLSIAAASIVAKHTRDQIMIAAAESHPHYGWHANKGYGSAQHLAALRANGISSAHRLSFGPVKSLV